MKRATDSSKTSVDIQWALWCYIPADGTLLKEIYVTLFQKRDKCLLQFRNHICPSCGLGFFVVEIGCDCQRRLVHIAPNHDDTRRRSNSYKGNPLASCLSVHHKYFMDNSGIEPEPLI
jgi:hypothetical protein